MEAFISICIPVFNSEALLNRALESIAEQTFTDYELVIVNDGSKGKDLEGKNCSKILKSFIKKHKELKKKIKYLEHSSNLGLLEARRTGVQAASGKYICILDSDDELSKDCLELLYKEALQSDADIIHGAAQVIFSDEDASEEVRKRMSEKVSCIYFGELYGSEVFDSYLKNKHNGFLWGKLIRRSVYLQALAKIPFMRCVMAEDFLQYFFISACAKKYKGIESVLYRYYIGNGISSKKRITNISDWEQICTTANVFVVIFDSINSGFAVTPEEKEYIQLKSRSYLAQSVLQLRQQIVPDLYNEGYSLLCEYWGKDFVEVVEKALAS
ncbi:MAG: glycosyltransferase [Treponema sp.]|nr:glycosyltransferase [Treponema sp.]